MISSHKQTQCELAFVLTLKTKQSRDAVMGLGKKLVMERELHAAFQSLAQPHPRSSNVSGVAPVTLMPTVHTTSNVAMDAALAARETAQLVYFNANFRLFKYIFLIQEGFSGKDRTERYNTSLGVDSRGSILKLGRSPTGDDCSASVK